MSCSKNNASCGGNYDCFPSDVDLDAELLCNEYLCNNSKRCVSNSCSSDSQCSQFGSDYRCRNGICVNYWCDSSNPCPDGTVCGTNGLCTSISCNGKRCPRGMQCKTLSDGSKVCLRNPGLGEPVGLLIIALFLLLIIAVAAYLLTDSFDFKFKSTTKIV